MKPIAISTEFIRANTLRFLILTLGLMSLPHIIRLPVWVSLVAGSFLLWRLLALRFGWRMPNFLIQTIVIVALVAGLFSDYHTLFGRDVGVALLILMLSMKTMEIRTIRDVIFLVCLGYFLVGTAFLYSQSVIIAIYLLATVVLMTATLVDLNRLVLPVTSRKIFALWKNNIRVSTYILLQAIPLMLILFVLFPRISGPLWSLPKDAHSAKSGLSDTMSPGTINQLILSNDIAFRVRFEGSLPPASKRYWRGPVLWYTDGKTWHKSNPDMVLPLRFQSMSYSLAQELFTYEVTLEAHDKRWIFALDLPASIPAGTFPVPGYQLVSTADITDRMRYRLSSYTSYKTGPLDAEEKTRALQLPDNAHPRTLELAGRWSAGSNPEAIVQKALDYFRNQNFVYTLLPELLNGDTVDQFLFQTREGFCEHYSSAFVVLMRAAGIPARVVTGYLGGEMNQFGDYMIVYQSDAHAWSEVWLEDKGWVRIDPTAAIAPERVQSRINNSSLRSGSVLYQSELFWLRDAWHTLSFAWDAVNQYWTEWVIEYDQMRQVDFLSELGMDNIDFRKLGVTMMITFMFVLAFIAMIMFIRKPEETDPVKKTYRRFLSKLGHKGIQKLPGEGPGDFMKRAAKLAPEKSDHIYSISLLYIRLRYSRLFSEKLVLELRRQVKMFNA